MAPDPDSSELATKLTEFAQQNAWSASFFEWAGNRKNDASKTKVERLMAVTKLERRRAIELLKNLQEIGLGTFVIGRHGQSSRMEWSYSLRSIGQAALGEEEALEELEDDDSEASEGESIEAEHRLTLGAGRVITIKAPQDLSKAEYTRLKRFIEALNPGE